MAHGTIAFDTLTTSDQVNTGTEKSIDTSYLFNGSTKMWAKTTQSDNSIFDSFNLSSITDDGTGQTTFTITNDMSDVNYALLSTTQVLMIMRM